VGNRDDRLLCIAFSPDSQTVAGGGYGNFVRLFDVQTQAEIARVGCDEAWSMAFRDDSTLIVGTSGGWEVCHLESSRDALTVVQQPNAVQGTIRGVIPVGEGLLVTGSEHDHTVAVWDAHWPSSNQEVTFQWPEGVMPISRLALNANRAAELLLVQRLGDGSKVAQMKCFPDIFPAASPTEDRLAVAESGTDIRIWNTTTWKPGRLLKTPANQRVSEIHFSASGQWLAAGCGKNVAGAWNLQSGEWRQLILADGEPGIIVQCSPARNVVGCAAYHNNVVEIWDLDQFRRLERLVLDFGALSICFSPDGQLLAVGETGTAISLWDTQSGDKIDALAGHSGGVTMLAYSPDGRNLVSGSHDETARLWNMANRRELFVLCRASQFNWFNFVDGSLFVAHGPDNKLRIFPGKTTP
jgi:WD40 repeat protein